MPAQPFSSIFGGIFGRKKDQQPTPAPTPVKEEKEPAKYHKKSTAAAAAETEEGEADIKQKIRELDRSGPNNLFGKYQRQRKTIKERNTNLESHLHPTLASNPRVSIEKFESRKFKRGL